ncbi:hypothetical protein FGO68_gene9772 [Halteria grandinella]|uniref:Uncharacterized protein n=1 Tax=Halteria grandinella TaxID=5974 RepID=A0A8J8T1R0_HALGN|nr:hypothetical protein FGO68_gene9772 [Halteria grandinella]
MINTTSANSLASTEHFPTFELLQPTPTELSTLFTISHSQVIATQAIDPYFMCILCKNLVSPYPRGPLECSQCQSIFCEGCIDNFVSANIINHSSKGAANTDMRALFSCPRGCQDLRVQKLHVYAQQQLNQVTLRCPYYGSDGCQEVILYSELIEHMLSKCPQIHAMCQCGAVVQQKNIKTHQVEACPLYQKRCRKCQLLMPRKELHRTLEECVASLLSRNKALEGRLSHFDPATHEQKVMMQEQTPAHVLKQEQDGRGSAETLHVPRCTQGHLMKLTKTCISTHTEDLTCAICQTEVINKEPFFWTCSETDSSPSKHSPCSGFAICHFCIYLEADKASQPQTSYHTSRDSGLYPTLIKTSGTHSKGGQAIAYEESSYLPGSSILNQTATSTAATSMVPTNTATKTNKNTGNLDDTNMIQID